MLVLVRQSPTADPRGPPITHSVPFMARRMSSRSVSLSVADLFGNLDAAVDSKISITEWRNWNRKDTQAIIKFTLEFIFSYQFFQILIGCHHESDIRLFGLETSLALKLFLLHKSQ